MHRNYDSSSELISFSIICSCTSFSNGFFIFCTRGGGLSVVPHRSWFPSQRSPPGSMAKIKSNVVWVTLYIPLIFQIVPPPSLRIQHFSCTQYVGPPHCLLYIHRRTVCISMRLGTRRLVLPKKTCRLGELPIIATYTTLTSCLV